MFIFNRFNLPFYFDNDSDSGGGVGELTVDDIDAALTQNDDNLEQPLELEEEDKEGKKSKKEDDNDDNDDEEKLELIDDNDDKPETLIVPVAKKKILSKYPKLFEDFPYLEKAYHDDQQYKELLPTIDDAKDVIDKAKILEGFEQKLSTGDTTDILSQIKNADVNAFNKIVDNYLPTLAKVDQGAFQHVVSNVTKQTIMAMANEAKISGNEELLKAASLLNQFAFGTSQFVPPKQLATNNPEQENQIQKERQQFTQERFSIVREDLDTRVMNTLKSTIASHIDPKGSMTDYVKRNATREALELTDKVIGSDQTFRNNLDQLWKRAFESGFNQYTMNQIRSAYLSKAKSILPAVIKKTRNEALRGLTPKQNNQNEGKTRVIGTRENSGPLNTSKEKNSAIPKGMSTFDYLMKD